MVYFGEYRNKVDRQGRIVIPAKFRTLLCQDGRSIVYVVRGLEKCLFLFSEEAWSAESEKLGQLPLTRSKARAFGRYFFSGVYQSKVDAQGRVLIPSSLLAYAGIRESTVIIGVGAKIEVWDQATWEANFAETAPMASEIADQLTM